MPLAWYLAVSEHSGKIPGFSGFQKNMYRTMGRIFQNIAGAVLSAGLLCMFSPNLCIIGGPGACG
jgi:hypothetical protein